MFTDATSSLPIYSVRAFSGATSSSPDYSVRAFSDETSIITRLLHACPVLANRDLIWYIYCIFNCKYFTSLYFIYARAIRMPPQDFASRQNPCGGNNCRFLHDRPFKQEFLTARRIIIMRTLKRLLAAYIL